MWQAQAPPGDRTFYKRQLLTIQKGYANASEGELLPVVAEVAPLSQGGAAPTAQTRCEANSSTCAPHAPQWLENDRKASAKRPPASTNTLLQSLAISCPKDRAPSCMEQSTACCLHVMTVRQPLGAP